MSSPSAPVIAQPSVPAAAADTPRPTTVIEAPRLSNHLGLDLWLASETFQRTGSFKFRAAYNVVANIPHPAVIAASSGNFGQAMAYACKLFGKRCTVVMPANSASVKVNAVREHGGIVELVDVTKMKRAERVAEISRAQPDAYIASAYDDPLVIEGNASLGEELAALARPLDVVVSPVGGGGLSSGLVSAIRRSGRAIGVVGAEPLIANDAARSLRAGHIVANEREPQTIADGTRTLSIGQHNWAILRDGLETIVEVPEDAIAEAVRLLFTFANLKSEPTGALSLAALVTDPERFRGRATCCVVSGGNVDPGVYAALISG
jgi:threonine dehydratase